MVKLESGGSYLIGKDNGPGVQDKWMLFLSHNNTPRGDIPQGLYFHAYNGENGVWLARASQPGLNDGKWHHVMYTREGHLHRIFIDGFLAGSESNSILLPSGISAPLTIGGAEGAGWVKGSLDQVRIYNRALSAAEKHRAVFPAFFISHPSPVFVLPPV